MAKLPRVTAKVFASNADAADIGQYGSALNGTKVLTSDIEQIQALPAYETGWRAAVISSHNYPTLQEMNGLQKSFSQQIAYLLENGVAEWDSGTNYYKNQFCRVEEVIYYSLIDNNLNNDPTSTDGYWRIYSDVNPYLFCGGVLAAPNGTVTDGTTSITIKGGIKFVCPNGRNADGSANNYVGTLTSDMTATTAYAWYRNIWFIQSSNGGTSWFVGGCSTLQWYIDTVQPTIATADAATWFNPETNITKAKQGGSDTWTEVLICPIAITVNDPDQSGTPTVSMKEFNTVKFLNLYDPIITHLDSPADILTKEIITYNSDFVCPDDGYVYTEVEIYCPTGDSIRVDANVNGHIVYTNSMNNGGGGTIIKSNSSFIKVAAHDVFKVETTAATGGAVATQYTGYFVPMKREYL